MTEKPIRKTLCSACGKYFSSTTEFDAHRVGRFGIDRRCATTEEMLAEGFVSEVRNIIDEPGRPVRQVWFRLAKRIGIAKGFAQRR